MWLKDRDELVGFLEYSSSDVLETPQGRRHQSFEEQERAYNFWKLNFQISIHRSNDCHMVKISEENILSQVSDIEDMDINRISTKRGEKLEAHKQITTKTYTELHRDYQEIYGSEISYGSFMNIKPFYISQPTEKETEMCLCSKCLNPHCLYKAIKSNVDVDLPNSLSDYLSKKFKCEREPKTNYFAHNCILGKCENKCKVLNILDDLNPQLQEKSSKNVHFYVSETVETKFFNTVGKEVSYNRTAQVDKEDSIENVIKQLQCLANHYLLHRFFILNDKFYWDKFLNETDHYTLWLDYSQNIAFKEKKQLQSAHFSGRQHTLHNTVIQAPKNDEKKYIYPLSDNTNHDSVMTFYIIKDIIKSHPEVIEKKVLVLCSDNCQEQYKCKYTFFQMRKLTVDLGIKVIWFYGEPGQSRGLVDAMSSFGCKLQLRNEIMTHDSWFESAEEMVNFLTRYFENDNSKEQFLVDAIIRKQK